MRCQSVAVAVPESRLPGYCLLFTPLRKRSEVTATTSIFFLSRPFLPRAQGGTKSGGARGMGTCGWRASWRWRWWGVELEKKKYRKGEQRSDSADKEGRRRGWGLLRRREGRGDVCIQLRADSSYANTANFLFYFISGAEICDLR